MFEPYKQLLMNTAVVLGVDPLGLVDVESFTIQDMQICMMHREQETDSTVAGFVLLEKPTLLLKDAVFQNMAKANALWCGTDGCTIGAQAESGEIIVACEQPLEWLTTDRFLDMLKRVSMTAALWQSIIRGAQPLEESTINAIEFRFNPGMLA